jgi:glycosyltransferase involved in cell wall biosynthesis
MKIENQPQKIVFVSTFPPTHCGIATFTEDTVNTISNIYGKSISCEIAEITFKGSPSPHAAYHMPSKDLTAYERVAEEINEDDEVKLVHIQHEFGLFGGNYGDYLFHFLNTIDKPIAYTFHTVLPNPNSDLKSVVKLLCSYSEVIFVMTMKSKEILVDDYGIAENHISVVPHGTHLVDYEPAKLVKKKFGLEGKLVLSTFGLLSEGKSIETGIKAMVKIVQQFPNVCYLILGKTHPNTIVDGEDYYRNQLESLVKSEGLEDNVQFVNAYLKTEELLNYLKATDVYLFTSKDANQAVSGTFSYAMSCSCPIVASKIPHTIEYLTSEMGILADIQNAEQFADATVKLLSDKTLRKQMGLNVYAKMTQTSWENTALKQVHKYQSVVKDFLQSKISYPKLNLFHLKKMTSNIGMVQFCKISEPDLTSGYTLDDNARAMIVMCNHFELTGNENSLSYIALYLRFIQRCQLEDGRFTNYIDQHNQVEPRNEFENLEDSNGRGLWALGTLLSLKELLPQTFFNQALHCFNSGINVFANNHSPRALAFAIKGLYKANAAIPQPEYKDLITIFADKIASHYQHNSSEQWHWFEHQLTYANSVLPEAMLISALVTENKVHQEIALKSMEFLSAKMFVDGQFKIISNKGWHQKDSIPYQFGEQPIEACYMMQALDLFYHSFEDDKYKTQLKIAFDWYLGKNHLNHIIHNPVTGGCYDGLEKGNVNLNQGAESTVCYLMSRLLIEKYTSKGRIIRLPQKVEQAEFAIIRRVK